MSTESTRLSLARRVRVSPLLLALCCTPLLLTAASAGQVGTLTTFTNGTVADATKVNDNFAALELAVNDNDERIETLEASASPIRIVLVSPVPGDAAASGTALRDALAAITDNSATNPYLIQLEPGVYDIGAGDLTMKPHVDLAGSGRDRTTITGAIPSSFLLTGALLLGASNSEIRDLSSKIRVRLDAAVEASLRNVRLTGRYVALEILTSGDVRLSCVHATSTFGMRLRGTTSCVARDCTFEGVPDTGVPTGAIVFDSATFDARHSCFRSEPIVGAPHSTGLYAVGTCVVRLAGCQLEPGRVDASGVTFRMVNCYDGNFDAHPDR